MGDFHYHMRGIQRIDGAALVDHALGVGGGRLDFTGYGAVHDGGDLFQRFGVVAALFGNQAWVGGDTGDNAHVVGLADLIHIGGINVKFHKTNLPISGRNKRWVRVFS